MIATAERKIPSSQPEYLSLWEMQVGADTGRLLLEKKDARIEDRITVSVLSKSPKGELIDVETGIPLNRMIAQYTSVDRAEMEANKRLEELTGNPEIAAVWISGPSALRSTESRINFYITFSGIKLDSSLPKISSVLTNTDRALKVINQNGNVVLLFASPGKHKPAECTEMGQAIATNFPAINPQINNLDQLRRTPLAITLNQEHWADLLRQFINLPDAVWQRIKTGTIFTSQKEANGVGKYLAKEFALALYKAQGNIVLTQEIYRRLEERAAELGYQLKAENLSCPLDIFSFHHNLGQSLIMSGEKKLIRNCGACGRPLDKYMTAGDKCPHCLETYLGC
jgi:hypothetical protein